MGLATSCREGMMQVVGQHIEPADQSQDPLQCAFVLKELDQRISLGMDFFIAGEKHLDPGKY